ncbi:hypothetical protein F4861DRAFT_490761 [Xylaria intraflava]|nr:hypothetical protein F4861DRAFT_490761 [Xylaria intraflava]
MSEQHRPSSEGAGPRRPKPARTFSDMGIPRPPTKRPSFLRKLTRKLTGKGPTPEEKVAKKIKKVAKQAAAEAKARREAEEHMSARQTAIRRGLPEDALRLLAEQEGVYLNPPPSRTNRFHHEDYNLEDGLVARVSGRQTDGSFVFLGSDLRLYVGRNELGRGSTVISRFTESQYGDSREIARAYYQLCK